KLDIHVMEKRKEVLSTDHPHTLFAMENLAATCVYLNKSVQAQALLVAVVEKRIEILGLNHKYAQDSI
ncbi:hypothetical protein BDQ12DRAFT_567313, partial [Crucibulum laeve]